MENEGSDHPQVLLDYCNINYVLCIGHYSETKHSCNQHSFFYYISVLIINQLRERLKNRLNLWQKLSQLTGSVLKTRLF